MKLTTQQIVKIEETLVLKGLIYDDIKLEVTDHIASEIEAEMEEKEISFETAFKQAFENWKEQLKPSSSFWVGLINSAPGIVMKRWKSTTIRQQLLSLLIGILPTIVLIGLFKIYNNSTAIDYAIQGLSLLFFCLTLYYRIIIWKSKRKTSFSLMFNKNSNVILYFLIMWVSGKAPLRMDVGNVFHNIFGGFLISWLFVYLVFNLQLAFKHFQFEKKLSISEL
jgi:hypothetical protein